MTTKFITTSIPYVNAAPHVGFALELVQADAIARFHRLQGNTVRLQTGTDEHALKNVLAAREAGVGVREHVDAHAAHFRALVDALDVSADDFLRTTEPRHRRVVEWFWRRLKHDDLYEREYRGRYCVGCEDFVRDDDLVNGECPDHARAPIEIVPASRKVEVLAFLRRQGLRDFSVTRPAARAAGWGISVPDDPSQVIYVWVDALINYVSALDIDVAPSRFWAPTSEIVHVIGKNVWKFHALYWPALLLSADLPLPKRILVHGFLTANGRKIGKSTGNAIDPTIFIDRYGVDALRYALLAGAPPGADSDFTETRLRALYVGDLANGIGNTFSRVCALAAKRSLTFAPNVARAVPTEYSEAFGAFRLDVALAIPIDLARAIDVDIARTRPWERTGTDEVGALLQTWLQQLFDAAVLLEPFLPRTSARIRAHLGRGAVQRAEALFPKLE